MLIVPQLIKKFPISNSTCHCPEADHSTPPLLLLKIHFYIILAFTPRSWKLSLSLRFPLQNPVCTCPVPHTCHMTRPSHSYLITRITLDKEYSSWWSSLCCLLQSSVMLPVLDTNIFFNSLFSYALSLRFSLTVRDQVARPYETTSQIAVLYVLILMLWVANEATDDSLPCSNRHSLRSFCSKFLLECNFVLGWPERLAWDCSSSLRVSL